MKGILIKCVTHKYKPKTMNPRSAKSTALHLVANTIAFRSP